MKKSVIVIVLLATLLGVPVTQAATQDKLTQQYVSLLEQIIALLQQQVALLQEQLKAQLAIENSIVQKTTGVGAEKEVVKADIKPDIKPDYQLKVLSSKPFYGSYEMEIWFGDKNNTIDKLDGNVIISLIAPDFINNKTIFDGTNAGIGTQVIEQSNHLLMKYNLTFPDPAGDRNAYYIRAVYKGQNYRVSSTDFLSK